MKKNKSITQIKQLIADNRLDLAIIAFEEIVLVTKDSDFQNKLTLLSARHTKILDNKIKGITDSDLDSNALNDSFLSLLDAFEKRYSKGMNIEDKGVLKEDKPPLPLEKNNTLDNQVSKWGVRKWAISLGKVLLTGGIIAAFVSFYLPRIFPRNLPPEAKIICDQYLGQAPISISCDGSSSIDPEGQSLEFEWRLNDSLSYRESNFDHLFIKGGKFKVSLKVVDPQKASSNDVKFISITIPSDSVLPPPITGPDTLRTVPPTENYVISIRYGITKLKVIVDGKDVTGYVRNPKVKVKKGQRHIEVFDYDGIKWIDSIFEVNKSDTIIIAGNGINVFH